MNARPSPAPKLEMETVRALVAVAAEFEAAAPWEHTADCDPVGLADSVTGDPHVGSVLGNAGEVFAAVFYRRPAGLRWITRMLVSPEDTMTPDAMVDMDALKLEFVFKRELTKEDKALLKVVEFKPSGSGCVWPQFRSLEPGHLPWFINQAEAEQLLADLPRLTAFCALLKNNPDLFGDRPPHEIPFLPHPLPTPPLKADQLEWRCFAAPPDPVVPFEATPEQLAQLKALNRIAKSTFEYDCMSMPGSILQNGRPCFSRMSLLVEQRRGLVLGFEVALATEALAISAGQGLIKSLLKAGFLPQRLIILGPRLRSVLQPLCDTLQIDLKISENLPALERAAFSAAQFMMQG